MGTPSFFALPLNHLIKGLKCSIEDGEQGAAIGVGPRKKIKICLDLAAEKAKPQNAEDRNVEVLEKAPSICAA